MALCTRPFDVAGAFIFRNRQFCRAVCFPDQTFSGADGGLLLGDLPADHHAAFWVFFLGLTLDILTYAPPGMNAFLFVVVQWVVRGQRVFLTGQPFIMIWIGFGFTAALFASAQFLIYLMVTAGAPLPTQVLVASTALTFVLFPPISLIFVRLHRVLPHTARA